MNNRTIDYSLVAEMVPSLVSSEDNLNLTRMPSVEEIRSVIFYMDPFSAPGPNGFTGRFFRIFGKLLAQVLFRWFRNSFLHVVSIRV